MSGERPYKRAKKQHTLDSDEEEEKEEVEKLEYDDVEGQEEGSVKLEGSIRITPFNMRDEMEEGYFDKDGTYHMTKETDIRDNWLDSIDSVKIVDKKPIGKISEHEGDDDEESLSESEEVDVLPLYREMLPMMDKDEDVNGTIRRLGRMSNPAGVKRKAGSWRPKPKENTELIKFMDLADKAFRALDDVNVYSLTWANINEKVNGNESSKKEPEETTPSQDCMWELKREEDGEVEGPYSSMTMMAMAASGLSGFVRKRGSESTYYPVNRIDFELYT